LVAFVLTIVTWTWTIQLNSSSPSQHWGQTHSQFTNMVVPQSPLTHKRIRRNASFAVPLIVSEQNV